MSEEKFNEIYKRIPLLDQGWVELQDFMGDDLAIVNAARVSFLGESKGEKADKKLLFYLMEHRHTSPFEQVEFKFRIHAPLVFFWHLVRHRTWSFNAQSGRYTPFEEDCFYIPQANEWRLQSKNNRQGSDGFLVEVEGKDGLAHLLTSTLERLCSEGYNMYKTALTLGIAKEQARLFLPGFGVYYTWICKVDAHNLMHFLSIRMTDETQYETRVYAKAIYDNYFKLILPWTAEAFEKFRLGGGK